MQGATPAGPSKSGEEPVGKSAITVGGLVVRSNATTDALPLPTNSVFPSGVTRSPLGPERGLTPFAREAQHCVARSSGIREPDTGNDGGNSLDITGAKLWSPARTAVIPRVCHLIQPT